MMAKSIITKPYTAKSRPIIFNAEMIRAILDGRKTQTRRVINPRSKNDFIYEPDNIYSYSIRDRHALWNSFKTLEELVEKFCPYGIPGDFLWVRESIQKRDISLSNTPIYGATYLADYTPVMGAGDQGRTFLGRAITDWKWKRDILPSIFMPRWASRISLRIVEIRVERVQELNREDFIAEGMPQYTRARGVLSDNPPDPRWKFIELWDSINAKKGYGWDDNPWVWVIKFERIKDE